MGPSGFWDGAVMADEGRAQSLNEETGVDVKLDGGVMASMMLEMKRDIASGSSRNAARLDDATTALGPAPTGGDEEILLFKNDILMFVHHLILFL